MFCNTRKLSFFRHIGIKLEKYRLLGFIAAIPVRNLGGKDLLSVFTILAK